MLLQEGADHLRFELVGFVVLGPAEDQLSGGRVDVRDEAAEAGDVQGLLLVAVLEHVGELVAARRSRCTPR
ncbi:hypothetical protein ACQ4WX_48800 [Streptomyces lasalocidi]